jgi:hypothetical protein
MSTCCCSSDQFSPLLGLSWQQVPLLPLWLRGISLPISNIGVPTASVNQPATTTTNRRVIFLREATRPDFLVDAVQTAVLDAGLASGECAGLVLIASNPFLGNSKDQLGKQTLKAVLRSLPDDELDGRLHLLHGA